MIMMINDTVYNITGLNNNTVYTITVYANNKHGDGEPATITVKTRPLPGIIKYVRTLVLYLIRYIRSRDQNAQNQLRTTLLV